MAGIPWMPLGAPAPWDSPRLGPNEPGSPPPPSGFGPGWGFDQWGRDSIQRDYFNTNPQALFQRALDYLGVGGGLDNKSRFAQSRYDQYHNQYEAGQFDPGRPQDYDWVDFAEQNLLGANSRLTQDWNSLSARQQGRDPRVAGGRLRWQV